MSIVPTTLRAPQGARLLEIEWSDGSTTFYRHRVLRGFCPCALCQGHEGAIAWVDAEGEDALELVDIGEAGQYGLRMGWGDGHRTGIYSFTFLRTLAELDGIEDENLSARTFERP